MNAVQLWTKTNKLCHTEALLFILEDWSYNLLVVVHMELKCEKVLLIHFCAVILNPLLCCNTQPTSVL